MGALPLDLEVMADQYEELEALFAELQDDEGQDEQDWEWAA